ncbi:cytidine deaminase [Arthrobacter sp. NPDC097144]|uniref:cytidine deaminase n=1 Tax=Arthrobacter sp. NPDC097144 TaxID=3363946 RepID=UPI00382B157B
MENNVPEVRPSEPALSAAVAACRKLIEVRFPEPSHRGAAAMLLADGTVLTGTSPDATNPTVNLCHEVGPYCDAFRLGQPVVASVCLHRDPEGTFRVLSPCGVCLERLAVHGADVLVAAPQPTDVKEVQWITLRAALPHYWMLAFPEELVGW